MEKINILQIIITIILSLVTKSILNYLKSNVKSFKNRTYLKASYRKQQSRNGLNLVIIGIVIVFGLLVKQQIRFNNEVQDFDKSITEFKTGKIITEPKLTDNERIIKAEGNLMLMKTINFLFQVSIYFIIMLLVWNYLYQKMIDDIIQEFERNLKIIKIQINKTQFEKIEADWAKMKTIDDYKLLNNNIDNLLIK